MNKLVNRVPTKVIMFVVLVGIVLFLFNIDFRKKVFTKSDQQSFGKFEYIAENYNKGGMESFDYTTAMSELNNASVAQDDPRLIRLIRDYYIDPPSEEGYNLKQPSVLDTSQGQSKYIDKLLNKMTGGFFVECGAFDGDWLSNSMFFERVRDWTGLLVEADPETYKILKTKHRKAFSINACLSTVPHPTMVTFSRSDVRGRIEEDDEQKKWIKYEQLRTTTKVKVQCFPLTSLLLALNQKTVDYFSLDIEGDELKVLKTIPMTEITVKTMTVEVVDKTRKENELSSYLIGRGYKKLEHIKSNYMHDTIYTKL